MLFPHSHQNGTLLKGLLSKGLLLKSLLAVNSDFLKSLVFGVIIDTFADLRSEKQQKEETLKNSCFICGLERKAFDNKNVTFEEHIRMEHNMWHYLNFVVLIKVKDPTEFTGPESYVHEMVKVNVSIEFSRPKCSLERIQKIF